jgi:hypothetical protein
MIPDCFSFAGPGKNSAMGAQLWSTEFSEMRLMLYHIPGREVATLVDERKSGGSYAVGFDARGLASGAYFYRLDVRPVAGSRWVQKRKLLIVR